MAHTLPPLPYKYDALEPYISEQIMTLHHTKHHQTYVTALNAAEAAYVAATTPKEKIALQSAIKFNGGGHINHSLFWTNLAPSPAKGGVGGVLKEGKLKALIDRDFWRLEGLKKELNAATLGIQGSGWGWLGITQRPSVLRLLLSQSGLSYSSLFHRMLRLTPLQDPLLTLVPLIGIDIWEHAFYLQYKNVKPDYLAAIWNVINFEEAEKRLLEGFSKL